MRKAALGKRIVSGLILIKIPPNLRSAPHFKVQDGWAADSRLDVCCTVFVITGRPMSLLERKTVGVALIGPYLTPHQI